MRGHARRGSRVAALCLLVSGCQGILGIPSESEVGCPAPCELSVSGRTVRAESTTSPQLALPNVTVALTSVTPRATMTTGLGGTYSFTGLTPGTSLKFDLSLPQSDPDLHGLLDTVIVAGKVGADSDTVLDLPVVQFRWLAKVAFQCGIFPTLEDALYDPGTTMLNAYFQTRSTVLGQVLTAEGSAPPLDRGDIAVVLNQFVNYHDNPNDTTNPPKTRVCFLEPDAGSGEFRGVDEDQSTSGRFVVFRVRNDIGTGTGTGQVRIPGFPVGPLDLSSGSVGFVKIQLGEGEPLPDRKRTFERDVYRYFAAKGCTACHRPGGIGVEQAPVRTGRDGNAYPADWSGTVEGVYKALTQPDPAGCATGTAARVCTEKPDASLLYVNPQGVGNHQGINNLPMDDPMMVTVLQWIRDGAELR